jgi:hypothetical protein
MWSPTLYRGSSFFLAGTLSECIEECPVLQLGLVVLQHRRVGGLIGEVDHCHRTAWHENSPRFLRPHDVKTLLAIGRQLPINVICLRAEFCNEVSGRTPPKGREDFDTSLLGAMDYFGLDHMAALEKAELRDLVLRGHPYTEVERGRIADYCEADVRCLARLLPVMMPIIELQPAIFRGRYTKAVAYAHLHFADFRRDTGEHLDVVVAVGHRQASLFFDLPHFLKSFFLNHKAVLQHGRSVQPLNLFGDHLFQLSRRVRNL